MQNKICGIYKITSPTNKIYIGQSRHIQSRFNNYKKLHKSVEKQIRLYNSFIKHGVEKHIFEIIEECELSLLNIRERFWQDSFNVLSQINGLNCTLVKTDELPQIFTSERNKKVSESRMGELNHNFGKPLHKNTIDAMIIANTGRKKTDSELEKASLRMLGELNHNYGKDFSKETRELMSKAKIGKYINGNHPQAKKVICTKTNKVYDCIKEAAKTINIPEKRLGNYLNGNFKNKTTLIFLEEKHRPLIKNEIVSIRFNNKIIIDLNTGVFYYSLREASEVYNINYTKLSTILTGANNITNFKYCISNFHVNSFVL